MIPEDDRGFLLGDGLFETFRTFERRPLLLARHLRRLTAAASEMRLPLASFDLEKMIRTRAEEQDIRHGSLRLTVTRGSGARGLMPPAKPEPRLILSAAPASPRSTSPVRAIISEVRRSAGSPSARMKTLSYNDNIMARMKAEEESAADAILFTDDGDAASTSLANILVLKDDRWLTPPQSQGGLLPGIVREVLLEKGLIAEAPLGCEDIEAYPLARCNSLIGVEPLVIEGCAAPLPEEARRLTAALEEVERSEP